MSKREYVKPYPGEFRKKVVQVARMSGRGPREIAEEFGVSVDSVRRWLKQADVEAGRRQDGATREEQRELLQLRQENRRLRMEREILAKAAAWFARGTDSMPSGSSSS